LAGSSLKLLLAGPWAGAANVERFKNEARTVAELGYPKIVPIGRRLIRFA
jgi:hypothetical protein